MSKLVNFGFALIAVTVPLVVVACTSDGTDASSAASAPSATTTTTATAAPTATATGTATATATSTATTPAVDASAPPTYAVSGSISGLAGTGLVLEDNAGDDLAIASGASAFTFATSLSTGSGYAVTVKTQPSSPTQVCSVANASGTVAAANVGGVQVTCVTSEFAVSGSVSGLADGSLVLQNEGGDDLTITASGAFTFATPVASGGAYAVTIRRQPAGQACTLAAATGTVGSGAVSSVLVNCTPNAYAVGGSVSGLVGTLIVQDNGGDDLVLTGDGPFAFATPVAHDGAYAVSVLTQPSSPNQVCTVAAGSGNVAAADVADVAITCSTLAYNVPVSVSGLTGSGLVLQDNGADDLSIAADGSYTFATPVADGQPYAVTVSAQPTNPDQVCTVSGGSGMIAGADAAGVVVTCQ